VARIVRGNEKLTTTVIPPAYTMLFDAVDE
jgi:hypothetical protein